jgi:hypothetical protein
MVCKYSFFQPELYDNEPKIVAHIDPKPQRVPKAASLKTEINCKIIDYGFINPVNA